MNEPIFTYDEASDTLYIPFAPGEAAAGTDIGPQSFPLTGLDELSDELREMVLDILLHPPVHDILPLSAYTPSLTETIPIISLQPLSVAAGTSS
jgi:hypothetical protein